MDFPDSTCDDGTPTGIGVNLSATSDNVAVFMDGGGACWDYLTCVTLNTSVHGPFGSAQFASRVSQLAGSIFDRSVADTPFADWNLVFVPYCTGDVHAGDKVIDYTSGSSTKTFHHKGHRNVVAYLRRLAATFAAPTKYAVTGSSAGGFGALLNFDTFRQTWDSGAAYLVDDSGPLFEGDAIAPSIRSAWFASWNLAPLSDPLCGTACHDDLSLFYDALNSSHPDDRMSLLESEQDATISAYFQLSGQQFATDLMMLAADKLDPAPNNRYFFISGTSHTMLGNLDQGPGGAALATFLNRQIGDSASWATVKP